MTFPLMFISGVALGFFYFSGLYWTVERLAPGRKQIHWLILSFLFRAAILAAALYLLADRDWQRLLLLTAGFTVSRLVWMRKVKKGDKP